MSGEAPSRERPSPLSLRVEGESHRRDNLAGSQLYRLTALLSVETRTCAFATCDAPADYEAEYLDGSWSCVCPAHAGELVKRAGWHDMDQGGWFAERERKWPREGEGNGDAD